MAMLADTLGRIIAVDVDGSEAENEVDRAEISHPVQVVENVGKQGQ